MPESAEVRALVEQGYLRVSDIAPILGVTKQREPDRLRAEDFPKPAKVAGRHRLWQRAYVEQ